MSNTNITEEVDKLVSGLFNYVNKKGTNNIEETIDSIRLARGCFEDKEEIIHTLSHTNFGNHNRIRDLFVKEYDFFRKNNITIDWMYDFLNCDNNIEKILKVGKLIRYDEISHHLTMLQTPRLYNISPHRAIGGGEYLMRLILSLIDDVFIPEKIGGISGDLLFRGEIYEVKGFEGRLDGAKVEDVLNVISKYEKFNVGKQVTVRAKQDKQIVKELLKCYFDGENPYPIIAVDKKGYVIIDKNLEWDDDIDLKIRIPKWMTIKAFDRQSKVKEDKANNRIIKIVLQA